MLCIFCNVTDSCGKNLKREHGQCKIKDKGATKLTENPKIRKNRFYFVCNGDLKLPIIFQNHKSDWSDFIVKLFCLFLEVIDNRPKDMQQSRFDMLVAIVQLQTTYFSQLIYCHL